MGYSIIHRIMKYFIGIVIFAAMYIPAMPASAAVKHVDLQYNCSVTGKPDAPKWVWYRYPTKKHPKRDKYNNGKVKLIWEDSDAAHKVEIVIWSKSHKKKITTADDAKTTIKHLKNHRTYKVKIRGVSNCGKGKWSKTVKVRP